MTTLAGTALTRGDVLPGAPLVDPRTGDEVRVWDFRGRTALVLCFLHAGCEECEAFAERLSGAEDEIRLTGARTFAALPRPAPSALPVLVDESGGAAERSLGPQRVIPTILVTDRYAAAWEAYPAAGHDFPPVEEVVASLWHLATICEECGIMAWPS